MVLNLVKHIKINENLKLSVLYTLGHNGGNISSLSEIIVEAYFHD